ncbi:non-ribosomal peptide synthetase [Prauserella marina]|uniref:Amino acid adenylation domain-containing protein n=1 Tax=Prauserella marina TaxID=530584 RepID=A0A222VJI5_9PSEU|nr:non-ribosomal peptide synthetase [Prauserella marina]ASR33933.1 non-ribosomal peptide synthetase [Prauserella marina]PWV82532.1 amino acid adenylation domain-containing protein [Prauserella marina]SDC71399.1 amino acid adenylation domain-containing protein [Prauserella marina]
MPVTEANQDPNDPGNPLTEAQTGIWRAQQLAQGDPSYVIAWCVELRDPALACEAGFGRLTAAVSKAMAEAESVHVRFVEVEGEPRQRNVSSDPAPLVLDFGGEADPAASARAWMRADRLRGFDLAGEPPFRHALLRVGEQSFWWYQRYHHLVMDGFGSQLVMERAAALYSAEGQAARVFGGLAELTEAETTYRSSNQYTDDRAYWLDLLGDRPEPARIIAANPNSAVATSSFELGERESRALAEFAASRGQRLSRVVVAAVAAYTHRMTGATDLVLGLPVTARSEPATLTVPGMASNVVPLRVKADQWTTPAELLTRVADALADLAGHSRFRGEEIARELGVLGGLSRLIGPTVNYLGFGTHPRFGEANVRVRDLALGPVPDLSIACRREAESGELTVELAAPVSEAELARHAAGFAAVLSAMTRSPEAPLGRVERGAGELPRFDGRQVAELTWHGMVERQAELTPDAIAVVCEERQLGYAELNAEANRLARMLVAKGIGTEDVVALAVPRSIELVIAILGVLKAGAAYLPLDPEHPASRIDFMVADSGAKLTVSTVDQGELAHYSGTNLDRAVALDNAAYVIYTSGSTGTPKGVVVTHEGIGSLVATAVDRLGVDEHSRVAQFASSGFDVAVWDLTMSLGTGARSVIVPAERRVAGRELTDYLTRHGATHFILPPSLVSALPSDCLLPEGAVLVVGTETVPPELVARWAGRLRVVAAYGLTEATVNSTLWLAREGEHDRVPIGEADPNTRAYVLDSALRPVHKGEIGELYIGGSGLARGYLGRHGLTASRFVADPFTGARMYRTGDRVRLRWDGLLDFVGRVDSQFKIRGHRIEPGEVEAALLAHPGIAQAAVVGRSDHRGAPRLVGYVVGEPAPAEVKEFLAARLPEHLVPGVVVALESLPLTPNGKVDRAALPDPEWTALAGQAEPRTPREHTLAALFAEVLDLPAVGVEDSFFELGGDSIVAIRLLGRAREAGIALRQRDIFQQRTVAGLARVARTVEHSDSAHVGSWPTSAPVSPLQRGFYFHAADSGTAEDPYVVRLVLELADGVPVETARARLQRMLDRHPLLRARFTTHDDGTVVQWIDENVVLPWREATDVAEVLAEEKAGFDLAVAPAMRATAVGTKTIVLTLHHIVADGWSLARLVAESEADDPEPATDPRPYLDWLGSRNVHAALAAWETALDGAEPTIAVGAQSEADTVVLDVPARLDEALTSAGRDAGLTKSTLLHGAWGLLLCALTGRTDVVFGTTVSGRTAPVDGIESMVGLFSNTVPARFRLHGRDTTASALARWQAEQAELLDHQHLPLGDIQRGHGDLFDTLVVVENQPDIAGTAVFGSRTVLDEVHYPLALIARPAKAGLRLVLKHRIDGVLAERIGARYLDLLATVAARPRPVTELATLSPEQWQRIAELNDTARAVSLASIVDRFAANVARDPDAIAVVADDAELSYRELDERSDRLAARLREHGSGPEQFVAVAIPRSAELVVALLGVLKSGAAYLPLDLDYPADRIAFMLADSGARIAVAAPDVMLPPEVRRVEVDMPEEAPPYDRPESTPDQPAYLIYTSGSTGRPKGVVVSHRAIGNRLAWMQGAFGLAPDDRVLHKTPSSFDVSVWEFFWPLLEGAAIVVAEPGGHADPAYLAELIAARGVTTLHFVPSMLTAFLGAVPAGPWSASLRRVFASGEALPSATAANWQAATGVPLHNLYGPTEAAVDVTWFALEGPPRSKIPIGKPVWNTATYVLDPLLRPVADGVAGELYLGGVQLARGYHGRPSLTASRFVANPFGRGRLYRTGDLVCRDTEGELEYLGRADRQVKVRGVRIELGEIEAVLAEWRGIAASAVAVKDDALVGYLVPAGAWETVDTDALREALGTCLPTSMVPSAFVVLDALPLTPSGKLDHSALPSPAMRTGEGRAPESRGERLFCDIVAAVLGLPEVAADADFFVLGGDSITAIAVSSAAREHGIELRPHELFELRTPRALAAAGLRAATELRREAGAVRLTPRQWQHVRSLTTHPVSHVWPLSPLQEGLYFHATYDPDAVDVYLSQESLDFADRVDAERLRKAANILLRRHPSLRAGFTADGVAEPVQFIVDDVEMPVEVADLSSAAPEDVDALLAADRRKRFDLLEPPLCRLLVIRLPDGRDRLVITHHLVLWDGWSAWLFLEQLLALYASDGNETELAAPGSYQDYLAWLWQQDSTGADAAWRSALSGIEEPTLVSSADREPAIPADHDMELSAEATAALRETARVHGLTLNTVLSTTWGLVLSSMVGRTDVVFGTVVAGRPADVPGVADVIGMFLNTVPTRIVQCPGETVLDLLRRVQGERVALMPHEYVGLGELQQISGHRKLFDTLFVLRTDDGEHRVAELKRAHGVLELSNVDGTHFPLALIVTPGNRLRITLAAREEEFPAAKAITVLDRFVAVLDRVTSGIGQRLAALDLLTGEERASLAEEWSAVEQRIGTESVADELATRAALSPDATALVFGQTRLTFAELDARINRLARFLLSRGAEPETVVALELPRSIDMVVALFAVLRTGAAYLPLDLDHPERRRRAMVEDVAPVCVLTAGLLADPAVEAELSALSTLPIADAERPAFAKSVDHRLDHPAYVIFTSGSTGTPKGVVTPYRGLTNMLVNHRETIFAPAIASAGGRRLRIAHTVSFAFDMSWEELLWLVEGHEVHVCDEDLRRDADALVAYCEQHRIDVVNVTPTYAQLLVEQGLLEGHVPPLVLLGGEAVPDSLWRTLADTDGTYGYNLYGPTEYTINTLGASTADSATAAVGRPIKNTKAHVLDPCLRRLPPGAVGELYIAGIGLARGYHRRPGLTAERFVADPFGEPGTLMYRTGDLVRRREDGIIDFLGRTDNQFKIRGYRVELGEIEAALTAHPSVSQAAVVPSGSRLVGYVVATEPFPWRDFLADTLPDYLIPATVITVDRLPLTVNGKLDVAALPAPTVDSAAHRTPRTERERILCGLFADVLGISGHDRIGIDDNFFELGGHSLLATRLVSRIRTTLDVELSIRDLFEAPTIAELVTRAGGTARPALTATGEHGEVVASPAQQRLWVVQQISGGSAAYNFPLVMRLRGELDLEAWQAALADVVARHESLRTVFTEHDGIPYQRVLPPGPFDVEISPVTENQLPDRLRAVTGRPFDLGAEAPIRCWIGELSQQEHVVALVLHHITTDEWSDRPFLRDLAHAYAARREGKNPKWIPLPVRYSDYTVWQQKLLEAVGDEQLAYWESTLAGLPEELELPFDRARSARPAFHGAETGFRIEKDTTESLRRLADGAGASMFMVAHAAVAALLHRLGAGADIPLGAPIAGRADEALDEIVGFFVNTLVLRADLSGEPSFIDLLDRVRKTDLAAFAHADVPFETVVERVNPARSLTRNPLFQVMVGHHVRTGEEARFAGLSSEFVGIPVETAKFDLVFSFTEHLDKATLDCRIEYSTELFDAGTVQRLALCLAALVESVAHDPRRPVADIDVIPKGERHTVLRTFNATARPVEELPLPWLFANQVSANPDAAAVVCGDRTVSYSELDGRSDQFAAMLAARGIGHGDVVGIAVGRSIDTVAAVLAVSKLGAVFLPLDLSHPADRIGYFIEDSGARLVVADTVDAVPAVVPIVTASSAGDHPQSYVDPVDVALADPAYVIYTSGSTGRPKGTVVSHDGIASLLATAIDRMGLRQDSVVSQFASIGFDVFVFELVMALCHGGKLVLVPESVRGAGVPLVDFLRQHEVTHMILPPSLMAALPPECVLPEDATILVGTETVPPELVERWAGKVNLIAAYGLTEATVNSTLWPAEPGWQGPIPIGSPDPNTTCYVLDDRLRPVPPGVTGELYVGGRGLALGYLGRHGLTAGRFVADPFGAPGSRLYRTGDRARWRGGGTLDFAGRSDNQVKVRGFRIELGEIESALSSHPAVRQAAVVADRRSDIVRLAGYVVVESGAARPIEWREHLRRVLPDYMIPGLVTEVDGPLPLTPNGKLDRSALPEPDWSALSGAARPATERQRVLATVFTDLLELDDVGVHDDFFVLGGHSMAAMRLLGRIRSTFGVNLAVRDVFESPTVAGLSELLRGSTGYRPAPRRTERPDRLPLAPVQRWLWELGGVQPRFDHALTLRSTAGFDVEAMSLAWRDVAERHESLRTVFVDGTKVTQEVGEVVPLVVESVVPAAVDGRVSSLATAPAEQPLVAHLLVSDREHVLVLAMRYLVCDEWSVVPLFRDLGAAYSARLSGSAPNWQALPLSYSDYACWSEELANEVGERQLEYWKDALRGVSTVRLPESGSTAEPGAVSFGLAVEQNTRLVTFANRHGVSQFMVLQAALATVLSEAGGGTDIPIGAVVAGRTEEVFADLVGAFANTVVLRTDLSGRPSFGELSRRVRAVNLAALDNQDVSFADVCEAVGWRPNVLMVQHEQADLTELEGGHGSLVAIPTGVANADLTFSFHLPRGRGDLHCQLAYAGGVLGREGAERVAGDLVELLTEVTAVDATGDRSG